MIHKRKLSYTSLLSLPVPCISESFTEIEIKLNFYFYTSLWCLKRFYEDFQGLHETFWGTTKKCENKNFTDFFSLRPGLGQKGLKWWLVYLFSCIRPIACAGCQNYFWTFLKSIGFYFTVVFQANDNKYQNILPAAIFANSPC